MKHYPQPVVQVLKLAERCTLESDIPLELKQAVAYCIASKMVWIQPVFAVVWHHKSWLKDPVVHPNLKGLFWDSPRVIFPCKEDPPDAPGLRARMRNASRKRLLLLLKGERALAKIRIGLGQKAGPPPKPLNPFAKKNINARMLDLMQKDKSCHGWTSPQWAKALKCSAASVVATDAWKMLTTIRQKQKAERARDRRGYGVGRRMGDHGQE
jgi:hypothetical protein